MSAEQIIAEIERLPEAEQRQVFSAVATMASKNGGVEESSYNRRMSFEEAADLVFRENSEAFKKLAQ
jgi:hypothetical protein